ncbi:MAG: hypothetical protein V3575_06045 [Candidatus Absconditabacteria bacterium]
MLKEFLFKNYIKIIILFVLMFFLLLTKPFFIRYYNQSSVFTKIFSNKTTIDSKISNKESIKLPLESLPIQDNLDNIEELSKSVGFSPNFNSKLKNYIANLNILQGNYEKGKSLLTGDDWSYYFNLGNIGLFKGFDLLQLDDIAQVENGFQEFQSSLRNYNVSQQLLLTGSSDQIKIQTNKSLVEGFRHLAGLKICTDLFQNIFNKFNESFSKMKKLLELFENEVNYLENLVRSTKDKELQQCLLQMRKEILTSQANVMNFESDLKSMEKDAKKLQDEKLKEPVDCTLEKDDISISILSVIENIVKIVDEYIKQNTLLSGILEKGDIDQIQALCEQAQNNQNNSDSDTQLDQEMQKLKDNLNKESQNQPQLKPDEQGKPQEDQPEQEQYTGAQDMDLHYDIDENNLQRLFDAVESRGDSWLYEMENLKGQRRYDPEPYLRRLFKDFYGNIEDFVSGSEAMNQQDW